jgi:hypothetical protein
VNIPHGAGVHPTKFFPVHVPNAHVGACALDGVPTYPERHDGAEHVVPCADPAGHPEMR